MDAESGRLVLSGDGGGWRLDAAERPVRDWAVDPDCTLSDSESEDVLHAVDPNEVFPSAAAAAGDDPSSESDSGISEDPALENAIAMTTPSEQPAAVYQVVYDISGLGGVKAEPQSLNVISIELADEWSSQLLLSDSCIVNELPPASSADAPIPDLLLPELQLTEEEQRLLNQEGVLLPSNLPLTKAEERVLKKVRRKIRNKQSAQDSRRRRKDYIDSLESKAAACSAQNRDLQRTVEQLEKHNMSLMTQLRHLQSLIKQTVSKGAQTSTCLLIILVSLALIILPSFSPFSRRWSEDDDYRTTAVVSRNILTDAASPAGPEPVLSHAPPSDPEPPEGPALPREAAETPEVTAFDGTLLDGSQVNGSALVTMPTEMAGTGSLDPAKPAHADEM